MSGILAIPRKIPNARRPINMNICKRSITPLCVLFAGLMVSPIPAARAQHEAGNTSGPSKYLYLTNVVLKPNQGGAYAKLESQEVAALRSAKAPGNYVGLWSVTGGSHVLYLHGFDSF